MKKYLITPTLLNSWKYAIEKGSLEDFIATLNKEPMEVSEAIQRGFDFEEFMQENYESTKGGSFQLKCSKEIGQFVLYGRVDCLKAGVITDYKYTGNYDVGKYYSNYQTPIYLELIPEAYKIQYIISNNFKKGMPMEDINLFCESYKRDDIKIDILQEINQFVNWLKINNLFEIFDKNWESKF